MAARKIIVFDFDQTISTSHLFKCLAGWERTKLFPGPHAASEPGQVRLLLDSAGQFGDGFYHTCLGGEQRVKFLDETFTQLKKNGCDLYVCSKGEFESLVSYSYWCDIHIGPHRR